MARKNRRTGRICRAMAFWLALGGLMASEYHGTVVTSGIPVPGATVTATRESEKQVTTTDEKGVFRFPSLADGAWGIQVEMLGFETAKRDVGVAPDAPGGSWSLKLFSDAEASAALAPKLAPAEAASTAPAARPAPAASTETNRQATNAPAGRGFPNMPGPGGFGFPGRGGPDQQGGRGGANQQGGRGGQQQTGQNNLAFQQLGVNQSADRSLFSQDGLLSSDQAAELAPSANEAVVVQGSMSSAMGLPGMGDFGPFGGRGGIGGPDMMMGGRGMDMGMGMDGAAGTGMPGMAGGLGADQQGQTANAGGGRGGPGGGDMGGGGGRGGGGCGSVAVPEAAVPEAAVPEAAVPAAASAADRMAAAAVAEPADAALLPGWA